MTDMTINAPEAVAAVTHAFETYEEALIDNDLAVLDGYFWDSEFTVRFGVAENLYGADAIQAYRRPNRWAKAPMTPLRAARPIPNSAINKGRDQVKRKMNHGMRKAAPPFWAMILGNRHIFPVPMAIPRPAANKPNREENISRPFMLQDARRKSFKTV